MKSSGTTSAKKGGPQRRSSARRSSERRSSPTRVESFGLPGPSSHPDPRFHAYRADLADIALAGRVIASHYAAPAEHQIASETVLRETASDDGPQILRLTSGDPFLLLDDSLGWAWGYAGAERRVGYVRSDCLSL